MFVTKHSSQQKRETTLGGLDPNRQTTIRTWLTGSPERRKDRKSQTVVSMGSGAGEVNHTGRQWRANNFRLIGHRFFAARSGHGAPSEEIDRIVYEPHCPIPHDDLHAAGVIAAGAEPLGRRR